MTARFGLVMIAALAMTSCGGGGSAQRGGGEGGGGRSRAMAGADTSTADQGRCDANRPDREVSEYDTSGDDRPDVRKVFRQVGASPLIRLVLICREADLNGDGTKDVVRYYNDEGRPLREEADRNFDGTMDVVTYFEEGRIVRQEIDQNGDGRVDTKVFFERGVAVRAQRDLTGRSTPQAWRPDRWEYFEDGRMVRMGTDLDGDGRVDRWDRDEEYRRAREALGESESSSLGTAAEDDVDAPPDAGPPDAGPPDAGRTKRGRRAR